MIISCIFGNVDKMWTSVTDSLHWSTNEKRYATKLELKKKIAMIILSQYQNGEKNIMCLCKEGEIIIVYERECHLSLV